jgi:small subunit ribosomal protein S7
MPRRSYKKRTYKPDKIYNSILVAKLINIIMKDGKKKTAETIVYNVLDQISAKGLPALEVVERTMEKVGPTQIVRPRRIGGASYMVPKEISPKHRMFLALKWLIDAARARSNKEYKTFEIKLFSEIMDAYEGKGAAAEKKEQTEKLAAANKVFAHFSW